MSAAGKYLRRIEGGSVSFWCPGCKSFHAVRVEGEGAWGFNGDFDRPTFTPSVLVRGGHYLSGREGGCWCDYEARTGDKPGYSCQQCHSYVTDGQIQFLADCSHELAGQTVPLPELPENQP